MSRVAKKFDDYVKQDILPKLASPELAPLQRLTGLHFIRVHELEDHDPVIMELLTTHYSGKEVIECYEVALDLLKQRTSTPKLVRLMTTAMLSKKHARRDSLFERCLKSFGPQASLTMLDMVVTSRPAAARRRLVGLVRKVSKIRSSRKPSAWGAADDITLAQMREEWERRIDPEGQYRAAMAQPTAAHRDTPAVADAP